MDPQRIRVRIAPSPTGDPHVGTAYIALFNYVFARQSGGDFILRIEDTDQVRARPESEKNILDALKWLGIDWDEGPDCGGDFGPYRQSERTQIYVEHANQLIANGKAYRCYCTPERLQQVRQELREQGKIPKYDQHCRGISETEKANLNKGKPSVVRLAMPSSGLISFTDQLRGQIEIDHKQLDDQVLIKSDGYPTYHLANVVDDHLMKITHVIRAEEWISSTPKHVELYRAFGWDQPKWIHMPLLRNADKSKISKRKNPVSLTFYRRAGFLPPAILNFLALLGWNPGNDKEVFSIPEMIETFSFQHTHLGGPVFDLDKLRWMNQNYLQKVEPSNFGKELSERILNPEYLSRVFSLMRERIQTLSELFEKGDFFFTLNTKEFEPGFIPQGKDKSEFSHALKAVVEGFDEIYDWEQQAIHDTLEKIRSGLNWKPKDFFMPIRLICTGRKDSPPLPETLEVLGRDVVRWRLRRALEIL